MKAGDLEERIALQSASSENINGAVTQAFSTFATVWAKILPVRGAANFQSAHINPFDLMKFCIRFREDVTSETRIIWGSSVYYPVAIDRTKRRQGELWITAQAKGVL